MGACCGKQAPKKKKKTSVTKDEFVQANTQRFDVVPDAQFQEEEGPKTRDACVETLKKFGDKGDEAVARLAEGGEVTKVGSDGSSRSRNRWRSYQGTKVTEKITSCVVSSSYEDVAGDVRTTHTHNCVLFITFPIPSRTSSKRPTGAFSGLWRMGRTNYLLWRTRRKTRNSRSISPPSATSWILSAWTPATGPRRMTGAMTEGTMMAGTTEVMAMEMGVMAGTVTRRSCWGRWAGSLELGW